jgi:ABC-2 type transport system permease protein
VSLATSFAATVFALGFVIVLFKKVPQIGGWRFEEVLFLYGFSLIPYGVFNIVSLNLYEFGNNYIIEGKFDRVLLRPVSSLFQVLFETFRIESIQEIVTGAFCMVWASKHLGIPWTPQRFAMLAFFGVCASLIYLSVFLILTTVSFWFEDRIGVHPPVWNVIAFGRYPLSIYSPVVQFFLCWIIPFGLASFYPSVRMLGRTVSPAYAPLVPVVAAVFLTVAISLWNFGTRHYSSTGS